MKYIFRILFILFVMFCSSSVHAKLQIDETSDFKQKVDDYLNDAKSNSTYLEQLVNAAIDSPMTIKITPITDDASTWHASKQKSRSHTEALDSKKK